MAKQDDYVRYTIRVPAELYAQLQEAAGEKSMNAEIVYRLDRTITLAKVLRDYENAERRLAESEAARRLAEFEKEALRREIAYHQARSLPFAIGKEFQQAFAKANKEELAEFKEDLEDLLNGHFPNAVLEITPEDHWRTSMEIYAELPLDFRDRWRDQVLEVCRLLAKDPAWLPPEETP